MGVINDGMCWYRLKENPLESAFHREWAEQNSGDNTLKYLLARDPNRPNGESTDRDRIVAATVIQWLGSPVGQGFLANVLRTEAAKNLVRRINEG